MSDDRITPWLEADALPAVRLQAVMVPPDAPPKRRMHVATLIGGGLCVLVVGLGSISIADFVVDQFARSAALGGVTAAIALAGGGMVALGTLREVLGLTSLRSVETLRAGLLNADPVVRDKAAQRWIRMLPEAPSLLETTRGLNDPDAVIAVLRAGPVADRAARADGLARGAAMQAVAGVAAMPSPGLAAVFIAWRGLRLIRQIADVYGVRPGFLASMGLVRRTAIAAGSVAGAEIATNAAAHALLSNAMLQHVAGDMAGAGLAARRMLVLGRAAADACSPLPREG